jgi:hypothetical protein
LPTYKPLVVLIASRRPSGDQAGIGEKKGPNLLQALL